VDCIGPGWPSWNDAGRGRCGCSRRQRPRRPEPSSARAATRPMTVMCGAGLAGPPRRRTRRPRPGRHRCLAGRRGPAPAWLVADRKVLQQRLHDQLQALCPGLSAPAGHGRALDLADPTGQAVLGCAATFAGRPPTLRSLQARAPGRLTQATARFWVDRWRRLLPPPADAELRAQRLGRDLARHQLLQADIAAVEARSPGCWPPPRPDPHHPARGRGRAGGQLRRPQPPIGRFPTPEHLYAATGLAPATYRSASLPPPRPQLPPRPA